MGNCSRTSGTYCHLQSDMCPHRPVKKLYHSSAPCCSLLRVYELQAFTAVKTCATCRSCDTSQLNFVLLRGSLQRRSQPACQALGEGSTRSRLPHSHTVVNDIGFLHPMLLNLLLVLLHKTLTLRFPGPLPILKQPELFSLVPSWTTNSLG